MKHAIAHIGRDTYRTVIDMDGHTLVSDETTDLGGSNAGPTPYDLILAGLGACTAITLRMYADRKQWPLEPVDVALTLLGDKDDRQINRVLTLHGLSDEQALRALDIAERTPVTLTLKAGIPISSRLKPSTSAITSKI